MIMPISSMTQMLAVWILPVLLAITIHEAAHALIAHKLGDKTAKFLGRLTLNPIKHIDLVGTVIVPLLVALTSGFNFIFGWAKPVPINHRNFKQPKRDMAIVAFAGPGSNLVMAFLWGILMKLGVMMDPNISTVGLYLVLTGKAGLLINLVLAFINLIPIPPLDGSRILQLFMSPAIERQYLRLEPYGFIILVTLLLTQILGTILNPLITGTFELIYGILGIR